MTPFHKLGVFTKKPVRTTCAEIISPQLYNFRRLLDLPRVVLTSVNAEKAVMWAKSEHLRPEAGEWATK